MGQDHQCGIYLIAQRGTDFYYIGSSVNIKSRWYSHRRLLDLGRHANQRLQVAWATYGRDEFEFSVLELCDRGRLQALEQEYLIAFRPSFNISEKVGAGPGWDHWSETSRENFRRLQKEKAAAVTHCPRGHLYDETNTYRNTKGKRICRACNALRVSEVYAKESPEQRQARMQRMTAYYALTKEQQAESRRAYTASHKEQKRAYDQRRRERLKESAS